MFNNNWKKQKESFVKITRIDENKVTLQTKALVSGNHWVNTKICLSQETIIVQYLKQPDYTMVCYPEQNIIVSIKYATLLDIIHLNCKTA